MNFIDSVQDSKYIDAPSWFKNWEGVGLIAWNDKNADGIIRYEAGNTFKDGTPKFSDKLGQFWRKIDYKYIRYDSNQNEVYIDRDIMVLANPEIANLPAWVIALVAAGGLAAALSTAALLLVISSSISHAFIKKNIQTNYH